MSGPTKYILVALPSSVSQLNDKEEALTSLRSTVSSNDTSVLAFKIPEFKIGTLDALVQQADELAKLESSCEAVVAKVGDSLRNLLEGDEEKIAQQKTVNDSRFCFQCYCTMANQTWQSPSTNTCGISPGTKSSTAPTSRWRSSWIRCRR